MAQRRRSVTRHRFEPYPMTDVEGYTDFSQTGRTGRRNALADILEPNHGTTSTSSLPGDMAKLKCTDDADDEASKSDTASALPNDKEEGDSSSKDKSKDTKKTSSNDSDDSESSKDGGS